MIIYPFREESSPGGLMQTAETISETNGSIYYSDYALGFDIVLVSSGKNGL